MLVNLKKQLIYAVSYHVTYPDAIDCYDNVYGESYWSTLKKELAYGEKYLTRKDAKLSIFEYIEAFYNRIRNICLWGNRNPGQYGMLANTTELCIRSLEESPNHNQQCRFLYLMENSK